MTKELADFLDKWNAKLLNLMVANEGCRVKIYIIGSKLLCVIDYGENGWEIMIPAAPGMSVARTLEKAEDYLHDL